MALSASSEVAYLTKQQPANANILISSQGITIFCVFQFDIMYRCNKKKPSKVSKEKEIRRLFSNR
jgi:hypothetical protein